LASLRSEEVAELVAPGYIAAIIPITWANRSRRRTEQRYLQSPTFPEHQPRHVLIAVSSIRTQPSSGWVALCGAYFSIVALISV
jgi:hypothetical protein